MAVQPPPAFQNTTQPTPEAKGQQLAERLNTQSRNRQQQEEEEKANHIRGHQQVRFRELATQLFVQTVFDYSRQNGTLGQENSELFDEFSKGAIEGARIHLTNLGQMPKERNPNTPDA